MGELENFRNKSEIDYGWHDVIIPTDELDKDVLTAIIEQYVLREGTDYGSVDYSLAEKVAHVRNQLDKNEVFVVYSELHESVDIIPKSKIEMPLESM